MPDPIGGALKASSVFGGLSNARRERLVARGARLDLRAGATLCQRGDPADCCYVILSGELQIWSTDTEGREVFLSSCLPGALVGEMAILDGGARSAAMIARRRTGLWRIGRAETLEALEAEPKAALALLAELAGRLRAADGRVQEAQLAPLADRLARLILKDPRGPVIHSQGEMARLIGASREAVNRTLAGWRARGWIEIGPSGLKVLAPEALETLAARSQA